MGLEEKRASTSSYKSMWARYVAQHTFRKDLEAAAKRSQEMFYSELTNSELLMKMKTKSGTGDHFVSDPDHPGHISVGIIGAGVAGLFTALLFDWLNEECGGDGLKIEYDILEAAGDDRLGGRLFTHKFGQGGGERKEHLYYDVGAMRFPNNNIMKRTFQLFNYIGLEVGQGGLIPYYYADDLGRCPTYFNDVRVVGDAWVLGGADPYKINMGLPDGSQIPVKFLGINPSSLVTTALDTFIQAATAQFDKARNEKQERPATESSAIWSLLMKADKMSVRQFLSSGDNGEGIPRGPEYNYNTIQWLETATFGTGWYDQSLTECVLEHLDFMTPEQQHDTPRINYWWCIDGGAQEIAKKMRAKIKGEISFNSRVVAIDAQVPRRQSPKAFTPMRLKIVKTGSNSDSKTKPESDDTKDYFAVFNSTTLGALQRMDLKDAGLLWGTKQAIRALGYGASCKVAVKFKTAWWQKEPYGITKGGLARTDLPIRVCVYPSYNIKANEGENWDPDKPAVLLCSYTWGQDAQRIGSLISNDARQNEEQLKSLILRNLALLHAEKDGYETMLKFLTEQYDDHHAWDWYKDENMSGAFAYFGPGQFSNMWQEIIKPNAFGQLYLIGEAASSHHGWVVGALESVIRAAYTMFEGLSRQEEGNQAYTKAMKMLSGEDSRRGENGGATFGGEEPGQPPVADPKELPSGLPFCPLPEEMPLGRLDDSSSQPLTRSTENESKEPSTSLMFPTAVAYMSLIESHLSYPCSNISYWLSTHGIGAKSSTFNVGASRGQAQITPKQNQLDGWIHFAIPSTTGSHVDLKVVNLDLVTKSASVETVRIYSANNAIFTRQNLQKNQSFGLEINHVARIQNDQGIAVSIQVRFQDANSRLDIQSVGVGV